MESYNYPLEQAIDDLTFTACCNCEYYISPNKCIKHHETEKQIATVSKKCEDYELSAERLKGEDLNVNSNYPVEPNKKLDNAFVENVVWYCSPDKTFGCWIKNDSKKRFSLVGSDIKYKDKCMYTSLVPLHDHCALNTPFRDLICWHVDEEGYGRYITLSPSALYKNSR